MEEIEFKQVVNSESSRNDTTEDGSTADNRISVLDNVNLTELKVDLDLWRNRSFWQDIT